MATNKNLRDISKLPPEEHRRLSSKGGKASQKALRELKTMREYARELAAMKTTIVNQDGTKQEVPYLAAVVASQYMQAIDKSDTRAAEFIATLLDELKQAQVIAPSFVIQVGDVKLAEELAKAVKDK